jgi:hypothetical protein
VQEPRAAACSSSLCDSLGNPRLPKQGSQEHNAIADARWAREAWSFLQSLVGVERATLSPLQAREEIPEDVVLAFMRRSNLPSRAILEMTVTEWKDGIDIQRPSHSTMEFARALFTAGQEWRDRIGEALLPFGLLARRYDHHKAPDDEIVRSHGTLGKPGDRGYTHITVSDLRRAAALLHELAAAGPLVAEKSQS